MNLNDLTTIEQLERFLDGTEACCGEIPGSKDDRYDFIRKTLIRFRYLSLGKREKGVVIRFLMRISGYSRQQLTRLIRQYIRTGKCVRRRTSANGFRRRYTDGDIRLLAELDELHETPCGAVLKKFCERAWKNGDNRFERLAKISVSHIYNLRCSSHYQNQRRHFSKTQSKASTIGDRRKPDARGQAGFLRVDTVHQGDQDGQKGVYHIHLVDEVTQMQICVAVERISESFLVPALKCAMAILPFKIKGFHSDNGSEFINKSVAELLEKLLVEFTKSRARRSNDNALVESKNGSVVRKHFGYAHIPQKWASEINDTLQEPLYRYLNFHRPCFFPVTVTDDKGKEKKTYPYKNLMTPCEKLLSLPNLSDQLKSGVTAEALRNFASAMSDFQAAENLRRAKQKLFEKIFRKSA